MKALSIVVAIAYIHDDPIQLQGRQQRDKTDFVVSSYVLPTARLPIATTITTGTKHMPMKSESFCRRCLGESVTTTTTTTTTSIRSINRDIESFEGESKSTTASSISSQQQLQRSARTVQKQLLDWVDRANIQISSNIQLRTDPEGIEASGYGWYVQKDSNKVGSDGEILLSVPSSVALVVESTRDSAKEMFPWYVQMALKLCQLEQQPGEYRPWIQSLPRKFDTPLHWPELQNALQYSYLENAVERQRDEWQRFYKMYLQQQQVSPPAARISHEQFVWGCECARSRAFAGSYSGGAYNPNLYIFTLLLITIYVAGNFGTLEQAANGAGLVFSATVLKDFVLPKFFKVKRYIICPMIDMTNHNSRKAQGEVAFEYFSNSYSLSIKSNSALQPNEQVYISYGARSNDQLLQYYGFVESNNPHDVYVMPPIRDWDISALEVACGRKFRPGRLQQLDATGLLGNSRASGRLSNDDDDDIKNDKILERDGVVLSRSIGLDPAILQALRVLVSSDDEWNSAGQSIGNFSVERSPDNEDCARLVARTAIEMELSSKPTTVEEDMALFKRMDTMSRMTVDSSTEERIAIQFRIEKKRLLRETIELLK